LNSTLTLISGLGLRLGLETSGLGLGLEALGLVNIPASNGLKRGGGYRVRCLLKFAHSTGLHSQWVTCVCVCVDLIPDTTPLPAAVDLQSYGDDIRRPGSAGIAVVKLMASPWERDLDRGVAWQQRSGRQRAKGLQGT